MALLSKVELQELEKEASRLRYDIVSMIGAAGSGHPGGSLSIVDMLTVLYRRIMNVGPFMLKQAERDRLVLSKGHAAPALYAALAAHDFFPREELCNLRRIGSPLQGHPDMRKVPGVEISTGSLGQGLSAANGMALAARLNKESWRVYVILGDGETQEGQIWEAAMTSAHYRLDNLTAFLDYNGMQIDGTTGEIMSVAPLRDKWEAFGWHTVEIDGHDFCAIVEAVEDAHRTKECPTIIIARTIKGKGVSFMEDRVEWHGTAPDAQQLEKALAELSQG